MNDNKPWDPQGRKDEECKGVLRLQTLTTLQALPKVAHPQHDPWGRECTLPEAKRLGTQR